ncbi:MAG: SPFH domain-containing protein [Phycisphaerae bacterium]|jgi:membrane protease subunit HflC
MKNLGPIAAAVFLAIVLLTYMCTFQVRFTEVAIKKTWGKPTEGAIDQAGLYVKWPRPIQSVVVFDKRMRILEDRTEETRTVDGKNLVITSFTLWKIVDPSMFHTNFPGGVEDAEKKLRTTITTHKHAVTGQHEFADFVSTDPAKRKIHAIEQEIKEAVAVDARTQYGVDVVEFGIKKLGLPESVTTAIFESMKSHEQAKAARYTAEGDATAAKIVADARATESRIMAEVEQKVAAITAEAERVVSEYYKEFDKYPALRMFLDALRTAKQALEERSTLILDSSDSPFNVFQEAARQQVPVRDGVVTPPVGDPGASGD